MPASSSSSAHISPRFNRRPKSSSVASAEEEQQKRLELSYCPDTNSMRAKEERRKPSNGSLVTIKEPGVKYRECRKNHAASLGGYAVDGCREFMAAGEEGTSAALKCAACGCHRSFHKREEKIDGLCDCSSISNSTSTPRK